MYSRLLDLNEVSKRKSIFLLGPRSTGKSYLIKKLPKNVVRIDLLKNSEFLRYQSEPDLLIKEFSEKKAQLIVIDEIQKLPELLNSVHYLIESSGHRFILTGSSARKLKREGVNLLGGRARNIFFHPLSFLEIKDDFNLGRALNFGLLPSIYVSPEPALDLQDYVGLYLREEIINEARVRNLPNFSRFLEVAALAHSQMINYSKMANDIGLAVSTVIEYFKLLNDTLIARELPAYNESIKRKAIAKSKFYFFDIGVVNAILKRHSITQNSSDFGLAFETFIYHELQTLTDYKKLNDLKYWRSVSDHEVDFIFDNKYAIEVKATKRVSSNDLKGLKALQQEKKIKSFFLLTQDEKAQTIDGIKCLPWNLFLTQLWGEY